MQTILEPDVGGKQVLQSVNETGSWKYFAEGDLTVRICFPFPGDSVGGSHVNALNTAECLEARGHSCTMVMHQEGALGDWFRQIGRSYEVLPWKTPLPSKGMSLPRNLCRAAVNRVNVASWLKRNDIDIIIPTDGRGIIGWARPSKATGKRLVYHHQTAGAGRLVRRSAELADVVITISKFNQSRLPEKLRTRSKVIPNAVFEPETDPVTSRRAVRELLGVDESQVVVGFVGNLAEQKRPMVFMDMAELLESGDRTFALFGNARDSDLYQRLVERTSKYQTPSSVMMAGFIPDLRDKMMGLDVLVAPQVDEGFGLNVAEAMAAGVPVVASNSGAHPEFVTHGSTGLLAEPDDSSQFAEMVARLLADSQLRNDLGQAGKKHIMQHHSMDVYGDRFEQAIME
ncbi:MAG: glycosyltransferase family 4 protein [Phycisphaerales bacterium]|nr:glycosyltransferase family 4 protein [Phycisphaerales bacterium]